MRNPLHAQPFDEVYVEQVVAEGVVPRPRAMHPADRHEAGRRLLASGLTPAEVARRLNCTSRTVHRIKARA